MTQAIAARDYQNLIDGRWVDAADGRTSERMSPAHDVVVGRYPAGGVEDLDRAVAAARKAFDDGPWPQDPRRRASARPQPRRRGDPGRRR